MCNSNLLTKPEHDSQTVWTQTHTTLVPKLNGMTQGCSYLWFSLLLFWFFSFSDVFSLTQSTFSLLDLQGWAEPVVAALPLSLFPPRAMLVQMDLGGGLLQRWQQALLRQVSLQGVEDVELLVSAEGQELLDHFAGIRAPERRRRDTHGHYTKSLSRQCDCPTISWKLYKQSARSYSKTKKKNSVIVSNYQS